MNILVIATTFFILWEIFPLCFWMDESPTKLQKKILQLHENMIDVNLSECIDYLHKVDSLQFCHTFWALFCFRKLLWLHVLQLQKGSNYQKRWREIIQNAMFVVIGTKYNERFQLQFWQNGVGIRSHYNNFLSATKL